MIRKKQLAVAIAATFVATGVAYAQQPQQPQKVEKVEVTGSNIKRTDVETVAPVDVITREQIEKSGQPTIAEVLRNVPANSGNSYNESFSNSFAPGASGISLRGLGQKTTLVLINGRRTAGYGFAQNLQDTFVDLNSIPSSAVERIEVLKDGASAIYGSDAIAGVVNVILRKDYKGIEASGGVGTAAGKNDYRFSLTGGFGDLGKDKYSVLGVFDYYKRDLVMLSDTDFGASRDTRGLYGGGRNYVSLTGLGTWQQYTNTGAATQNFRAVDNCAAMGGTVMTGPQAAAAGLINLSTNQSAANIAALTARAAATNTFCTYDQNKAITAVPSTERYGFLGRATVEISPNLQGYAELGLSEVKSFQVFTQPFFNTTALTQTSVGLRPFSYTVNFAPGVGGNPFSTLARYTGALNDMGTRDTAIKSDTYRVLAGLKWTAGNWDGDSAVGWSRNEVTASNYNRLTLAGVSAAFGIGTGPQPPIPTANSSTYNLNNSSANSAAVRDSIRANFDRKSSSELFFVDTRASTEFTQFTLPGGPVGLAVGAEYRDEKLNDTPAAIAQQGLILGQGITKTSGSRNSFAVFAEASLPILKNLEGQIAGRSDHYSDYGSSTVPKVGLKWKVTPEFVLRANWGQGFRAPTLPEISPSVATFFVQVNDPVTGQTGVNISGIYAGNPNLRPETSDSTTIGAVFEPTRDLNLGLTWYQITWKDQVASYGFQTLVNNNGVINGVQRGIVTRDPVTNNIVTVQTNYTNLGEVKTSGLDFDLNYRLNSLYGKFGFRLGGSYLESFKADGDEYVGQNGYTSLPRIRGFAQLNWEQGPYSAAITANYIHSYYQALLAGSYYVNTHDPSFQTGVYGEKIGSRTTVDLFGGYEFNKNMKISGSVLNVMNRKPPYDPGASSTYLYDFTQYDVRGRAYRLNMTYKFK
ncbi:MAG: TonB-dependent receptor [Burkholderiales bacterium]|nr:TonB-dependent receptor [Burkholderiales bacterium]